MEAIALKYIRFAAALSLVFIMLFAAVACTGAEAAAEPDPGDVVNIPEPTHTQAQTGPMASATPANTDERPETTPSEPQSPEPAQTPDDGLPYYLYVEKGSFTLTIYEKDEQGEYTKVLAAYRIAHGGNKTPAGTYTLGGEKARERWHDFPDGGTVQYATRYEGRLYIHSPLYATSDPTQMWPKYYNGEKGIGLESTGGCLRMVTEAAKFIYENCPEGTTLKIVNGSPLGTTSDDVPSRNGLRIDPTDYETLKAKGYAD